MGKQIGRRQALAAFGVVGFGSVLAACGGNDDGEGAASGTATTGSTSGATSTASSGAGGAGPDLFAGAGSCTATPELTEGPYYIDVDSIRSDIREDREGVPLRLAIRVRDADGCKPRANAVVDVWHCDATGLYSGFEAGSTGAGGGGPGGGGPGGGGPGGGGPGGGGNNPTDTRRYLRGSQVTNPDGIVEFKTIYPGWYRGRTVHIHTKVHLNSSEALTTQLFFDENVTKTVYAAEPYASDRGRDTFNDSDAIFAADNLLKLSKDGDGYLGVINIDVTPA